MSVHTEASAPLAAPALPTEPAADEAAIRALFQALLDCWGRGDGQAYGALFTADADYVAFDGSRTRGRDGIATIHQHLFDTWLKGTRLVGQIESLRFLAPTVALVHATGSTIMRGRSTPSRGRQSIQTLVAVKDAEGWRFTAFHNNRIQRMGLIQKAMLAIATVVFRR